MKRALVIGLGLGAAALGAAADERRQALEQRVRLAERLIADSATAQRIAASGDIQAVAQFDEGRLHLARAQDALRDGDLDTAQRAVDEALRQVGRARRMVPDAGARQATARLKLDQGLQQMERLVEAWRVRAVDDHQAMPAVIDATGRIGHARALEQAGRIAEAQEALAAAEGLVLAGMARHFAARELNYTVRAASPEEAFQLEFARCQALAGLVPLALAELKPRGESLALVQRYAETSRQLSQQAQLLNQRGDTGGAQSLLRSAVGYVERALAAAGLVMPGSDSTAGRMP
jgi:tetratricopeptide (TPR) repeat protein